MKSRSPVFLAAGGFIAMAVGIGIGRFVYTPILPPMAEALGLSKSMSGLIASANFTGYLIGAIGASRAALPGSRRIWLIGALILSAVTTFGMGMVSSIPAFVILRLVGGAASALALILSSALVLDRLAGAGRPRLAALHFAGVGIGIAVSAAVVSWLLTLAWDWRTMWWASGILSFMGALAVAALVPREAVRAAAAGGDAAPVSNPRLRRMTFAYGLFGFGYVITATFLVAIVRDTPAARDLERAVWIVAGLAAAPSVAFWSSLGRRFGLPTAFAAAALTEACGVLASVIWPGAVGLCLAAVLVGGTFMGLTALGLMRGRELALGHDPRRVMAAMTAAFGVGQIAGPVVAGAMSDALGGFMAPSVMAAAALVLAAWLARR